MIFLCGHVYVYPCSWIKNPHDKISLCVCNENNWFFWFNSTPAFHNHGQLLIQVGDHPAIAKQCYLDLSGIRGASPNELANAKHRGPINQPLLGRILTALEQKIIPLRETHRELALKNLSTLL